MTKFVRVFDTTLRDGDQTPGVHLRPEVKVELAKMLEAFGVAVIEAGFPASSPGDFEAVQRVASEIHECEVAALARCRPADIDAVCDALAQAVHPVVHIVLGVSDVHLEKKLGIDRREALEIIQQSIARARRRVAAVEFSAEDATRADRVFLKQCFETAIEAGADRVNVPDTVGCALPNEYGPLIGEIVRFVGGAALVSAHCHDDLGLATANTIAAVQFGATQVEVTVNGIGERAGNAAVEEVGVALAVRGIAETGLQMSHICAVSAQVAEATGVPVAPNHPIVGANAFAHSSGIHQDGILKDRSTYEFVAPETVGIKRHQFVYTARSGRHAIADCVRKLGFAPDAAAMDAIYRRFLEVADARTGAVPPPAIYDIAAAFCPTPALTN